MEIQTLVTGPAQENCYLVSCGDELLIVDPGAESKKIKSAIDACGKTPRAILLTHAHYDHIGALDDLRETYKLNVYASPLEKTWYTTPTLNLSAYTPQPFTTRPADFYFTDDEVTLGVFHFKVVPTPGHSVGSVSFIFDTLAIVGDTLFRESIGRTDFPTGDLDILRASINEQLLTLPDDLPLYPGHGPATTAGFERAHNPYLGGDN